MENFEELLKGLVEKNDEVVFIDLTELRTGRKFGTMSIGCKIKNKSGLYIWRFITLDISNKCKTEDFKEICTKYSVKYDINAFV